MDSPVVGRVTPTMVWSVGPSRTRRPTTAGSEPKRVRHGS
jgi:hypothetical protein